MQIERGSPEVLRALEEVTAAHRLLLGAGQVPWQSVAADRFRAAVDEAEAAVRQVRAGIELAVRPVAVADAQARPALGL